MLINCQYHAAKVAPNTKRHNFASNNLELKKLKSSTLNLYGKHKTKICVIYAFKKIARIYWFRKCLKSSFYDCYV